MKIIGLDVGTKRIGVARADSTVKIAVPIGFIEVDGTEFDQILKIARQNSTNSFVIGLPRSLQGEETAQSRYTRLFAKKLKERLNEAKIAFQDESLTSIEAENRLKKSKKPYEKLTPTFCLAYMPIRLSRNADKFILGKRQYSLKGIEKKPKKRQ